MTVIKTMLLLLYVLEFFFDTIWYKIWGADDRDEEDIRGKVAIITGANAGIGRSLARKLAQRGATVILGCRNLVEGRNAQEDIMFKTGTRKVILFHLDLEDFSSVRKFAEEVGEKYPEIHFLVNNAGVCIDSNDLKTSRNGYELHMCVNHLGHFLLANLLLPNIKRAAPSRIVVVSSSTLIYSELDLDDIMLEKHPNPTKRVLIPITTLPYNNSKMANSLFAKELGKRLEGSGVTAYSVCPGLCETNIFRGYTKFGKIVTKISLLIAGLTTSKAAESVLYCILSRKCEHETGKFYRFEKICVSGNRKLKTEEAKKLWRISENTVQHFCE